MLKLELNFYDIKKGLMQLMCRYSVDSFYFIETLVQYLVQYVPGNISLNI